MKEIKSKVISENSANYDESLNRKFKHRSWFIGGNKTIAYVLDYFARTGDFRLSKKKAKVQSQHLLDDWIYDDVIIYSGKEGGTYRVNENEKAFFLQRKEYWKPGKIAEVRQDLSGEYQVFSGHWSYDHWQGIEYFPFGYSRTELIKLFEEGKLNWDDEILFSSSADDSYVNFIKSKQKLFGLLGRTAPTDNNANKTFIMARAKAKLKLLALKF